MTMAIMEKFLCWPNTRVGSAICGYYTLVISVVCLGFYLFRYIALDAISKSVEFRGIVYAGFVLYSLLIGSSLILLPGVYMDKRYLMLPWIYVLVVTILYETGAVALLTTVHLEYEKTLEPWEIISVCFYMFRLVANCYCFACVVSQYQELTEGRGTYDFLYKQPRRPVSNDDVYSPPQGATLPPYSYEDQHKEYSPPNYDNLSFRDDNGAIYRTESSGCLYNECLQYSLVNDVMGCSVHVTDCCVDVPEYRLDMTSTDSGDVNSDTDSEYSLQRALSGESSDVRSTSSTFMADTAEVTSLSVDTDVATPEFRDASLEVNAPVIQENSEHIKSFTSDITSLSVDTDRETSEIHDLLLERNAPVIQENSENKKSFTSDNKLCETNKMERAGCDTNTIEASTVQPVHENSDLNEYSIAVNKPNESDTMETVHCDTNRSIATTLQTMNGGKGGTVSVCDIPSENCCAQEIATSSNGAYDKQHKVLKRSRSMTCNYKVPANKEHRLFEPTSNVNGDRQLNLTSLNKAPEAADSTSSVNCQINGASSNKERESTSNVNYNRQVNITSSNQERNVFETTANVKRNRELNVASANQEREVFEPTANVKRNRQLNVASANQEREVFEPTSKVNCDRQLNVTSSNEEREVFESTSNVKRNRQLNVASLKDVYNIEHGVLKATLSGSSVTKPVGRAVLLDGDYRKTTHLTWI